MKIFETSAVETCPGINNSASTPTSTITSTTSISSSCSCIIMSKAVSKVKEFYNLHSEIKTSHGWTHIEAVLDHTTKALASLEFDTGTGGTGGTGGTCVPSKTVVEIKLAALLHDIDDKKYFPNTISGEYPNASAILEAVGVPQRKRYHHDGEDDGGDCDGGDGREQQQQQPKNANNANKHYEYDHDIILKMISWVSCSENGNTVPEEVKQNHSYHLLIPRWADRLEAVGKRGVIRCYQYNQEKGAPLYTQQHSPCPQNEHELWTQYVKPHQLQDYMDRGGTSTDMISHYYDKLLHISKPPKDIVQNKYLEKQADMSSKELVEVCLRFGRTGEVDEDYILSLSS